LYHRCHSEQIVQEKNVTRQFKSCDISYIELAPLFKESHNEDFFQTKLAILLALNQSTQDAARNYETIFENLVVPFISVELVMIYVLISSM